MKSLIKYALLLLLCPVLSSFNSCSPFSPDQPVTVLSWNIQNLFDGVDNGGEYPEFDPGNGSWNTSLFYDRIELLGQAILESCPPRGPDVLVLQEIENRKCMEELNRLALGKCGYRNRFITDNSRGIQTALLTRCRVNRFRCSRISLPLTQSSPLLRDIAEAEIETPFGSMNLYINHWKSRRGGVEETEIWRLRAASLLCRGLNEAENDFPILICGDLNTTVELYNEQEGELLTALLPVETEYKAPPSGGEYLQLFGEYPQPLKVTGREPGPGELFSPWLKESTPPGSYSYRDRWERLDHFLLDRGFFDRKGLEYAGFDVIRLPCLMNKDGTPKKWITELRSGYSDHFPILLRLG